MNKKNLPYLLAFASGFGVASAADFSGAYSDIRGDVDTITDPYLKQQANRALSAMQGTAVYGAGMAALGAGALSTRWQSLALPFAGGFALRFALSKIFDV